MKDKRRIKHTLIAVLITIIAAQLDIDLITSGFKIAIAVCIIAATAYVVSTVSLLPMVLLSDAGIMITRIVSAFLRTGDWSTAVTVSFPEGVFYLVYGLLMCIIMRTRLGKINRYEFAGLTIIVDFLSNYTELSIRLSSDEFTSTFLITILIVAIIRAAILLLLLTITNEYRLTLLRRSTAEQYQRLMMMMSRLQGELTWMEKSSNLVERTMSNSYKLYSELNNDEATRELAQSALTISKDIHEIKKEYYLIARGIREVMNREQLNSKTQLSDLLTLIKESIVLSVPKGYNPTVINVNCEDDIVVGRPFLIMSVITNLIINAIEACVDELGAEARPVVNITVTKNDTDYVIRVADNGPGIPEDIREDVFMAGYSTKINYETGVVGRGLGLSIVRDIVEGQFGGKLIVESDYNGTTFEIVIDESALMEASDD